ncbi:hypothetical protein HMPREF0293_2017 [Corynebacterium glucuronolyticum ATCC 51866]|uniref:Uncharacterized protein n=1 Tax=Corynebacterium glucuronolyticum ATCC 51866 TaxID=548478 RepID=A0ABM9XMW5_9CORY|nr:hypothetical protein HMPREF0293_2017 [Corynebacterium glucuronolyticum ATCC 51866]
MAAPANFSAFMSSFQAAQAGFRRGETRPIARDYPANRTSLQWSEK